MTTDARGEAWTPGPSCPHPEPAACPARLHRPYCRLAGCSRAGDEPPTAAEAAWRPRIAAQPPRPASADLTAEQRAAGWVAPDPAAVASAGPPAPPPEPPLPGRVVQTVSYTVAKASHVAAGSPRVDEPTYQARLAICRACAAYRPSDERCSECGCYLADDPSRSPEPEGKARWADQQCPLNPPRWLAYQMFDNPPRPGGCCGGGG